MPGTCFEGNANVTFEAKGDGADGDDSNNHLIAPAAEAADKAQGGGTPSSLEEEATHSTLQQQTSGAGGASNTASFEVTFFHCEVGSFWNRTDAKDTGMDGYTGECEPCTEDNVDGGIKVCKPKGDDTCGS